MEGAAEVGEARKYPRWGNLEGEEAATAGHQRVVTVEARPQATAVCKLNHPQFPMLL